MQPKQTSLPLVKPARCRRCGRDWSGVYVEGGMDLVAFMALDDAERDAVVRCWVGACGGETAT
jgi:hypothetical protein